MLIDDVLSVPAWCVEPSVVVIGNFDGVHRGHAAVLQLAMDYAKERSLPTVVLTFHPHPSSVLQPIPPPLLTTLDRRVELLARFGVSRVYARRFDARFARCTPEQFVRHLLVEQLQAKAVVVGHNFRFGADRAGDFETLSTWGERLGFAALRAPLVEDAKGAVSSSRVRDALAIGDLSEVEHVLGRHHGITGTVIAGGGRGRTLGFPTANLDDIPELLPLQGVYAVLVNELDGENVVALSKGVMNIGVRPTFERDSSRKVEVHLFDIDRDLYGKLLRVHPVARLREEQRFENQNALREQIDRDVRAARERTARIEPIEGAFE